MEFQSLDAKALEKLAKICRKSGIRVFKGFGVEFTLADSPPLKRAQRNTKPSASKSEFDPNPPGEGWEQFSEEEKLFWSSNPLIPPSDKEGG